MSAPFKHAVEIGAGDSHSSEGLKHAATADRVTLFEPNAILFADLLQGTKGIRNITALPLAVIGNDGWMQKAVTLYHMGYASWLDGAPSFMETSIEPEGKAQLAPLRKVISAMRMDMADDGSWSHLVLTSNGCDAEILRSMKSRPEVIWTKHYCHNERQWGETHRVAAWMRANGYVTSTVAHNQHHTFLHFQHRKVGTYA